ncbi:MAG: hypothetical protein ABGY96_16445 [bacterium]|nr:hypothetical protein [Gammaproteobacteria bacterium]HIL99226.1 hypothetical protein [Pseudomonadales bacterium]
MSFKQQLLFFLSLFLICQFPLLLADISEFRDDDIIEEQTDDTPEIETEGSIDAIIDQSIRGRLGWV